MIPFIAGIVFAIMSAGGVVFLMEVSPQEPGIFAPIAIWSFILVTGVGAVSLWVAGVMVLLANRPSRPSSKSE